MLHKHRDIRPQTMGQAQDQGKINLSLARIAFLKAAGSPRAQMQIFGVNAFDMRPQLSVTLLDEFRTLTVTFYPG